MSKVYTGATMSIDGYISGPDESGFDHLFQWYGSGEVEMTTTHEDLTFRLTRQSAEHLRAMVDMTGVLVVGRHLFDITSGWGGSHPLDLPVVVVTHSVPDGWPRDDAPFTFVTEGIERAIEVATEIAGDKSSASTAGRSLASASRPACSTRSGSTSRPCSSAAAVRSSTRWRVRRTRSTGRCRSSRATASRTCATACERADGA
jgi:hypothetical protein